MYIIPVWTIKTARVEKKKKNSTKSMRSAYISPNELGWTLSIGPKYT